MMKKTIIILLITFILLIVVGCQSTDKSIDKISEAYNTGNEIVFYEELDLYMEENPNDENQLMYKILPLLISDAKTLLKEKNYEACEKIREIEEKYFVGSREIDYLMRESLTLVSNEYIIEEMYDKAKEISDIEKQYFPNSDTIDMTIYENLFQKTHDYLLEEDYSTSKVYYDMITQIISDFTNVAEADIVKLVNTEIDSRFNSNKFDSVLSFYNECKLTFGNLFDNEEYNIITEDVTPPIFIDLKSEYVDEPLEFSINASKDCIIYYTLDGKIPTSSSMLYTDNIQTFKGETEIKAIAINGYGTSSVVVSATFDYRDGTYDWLNEDRSEAEYVNKYLSETNLYLDLFRLMPMDFINELMDTSVGGNHFFNRGNETDESIHLRVIQYLLIKLECIDIDVYIAFREVSNNSYSNFGINNDNSIIDINEEWVNKGFVSEEATGQVMDDVGYTALLVHSGGAGYIKENYPESDLCKKIDIYINAIKKVEPEMSNIYFEEVLPAYINENCPGILDWVISGLTGE